MKCSVKVTEDLLKELNKPAKILSIFLICMGCLVFVACFTPSFYSDKYRLYLNIFMAFLQIIVGIYILFLIKNNTNKQLASNQIDDVEFFENYLAVQTTKNGEVVENVKVKYSDLIKARETQNYIFLFESRINVIVADKKQLGDENVKALKALLSKENKNIRLKI